jgi:phosphoglycolate phosphatase-like HAD superfamily hydrolase
MPLGRITRLVPQHGFGFLIDDAGMDWFFVREDVREGFDLLTIVERVGFSPEWTPTGPRAADIHYELGELSLVLFDVDGTLLLSGGAGVRAMTRAFEALFGVADAFRDVAIAGLTDTHLLSLALGRAGLPDTAEIHARFRDAYISILADEIGQPGIGRRGVMPGIEALLSALSGDPRFHLALLTGNYERAAHIKLSHFGLLEYFPWGVFGEESADRNDLGRIAMIRARDRGVPESACARAVVIGDTPHDIACARAAGARAVTVATGAYSMDELRAAGADVTLADLSNTAHAVQLLAWGT